MRGQFHGLVAPLGRSVDAGDQGGAVDPAEIAEHEGIAGLGLVAGALGQPEVPGGVLGPAVLVQERVLVVRPGLHLTPVAVQHVLPRLDQTAAFSTASGLTSYWPYSQCHGWALARQRPGPGWNGVRALRQYVAQLLARSGSASGGRGGGAGGEDGDQGGELLRRGVALDDLQDRLGHSGMFPCFLGGRVSRLVRSSAQRPDDLRRGSRDGVMTAST